MSRLGRTFKQGRTSIPPWCAPGSFWNRKLGPGDTVSADQTPAHSVANKINYGNDGSVIPYTFQGYSGIGAGNAGAAWPFSISWNGLQGQFSHPIYCVRPSDPTHKITFQTVSLYYMNGQTVVPDSYAGMQTFCMSVPIPDKALCSRITGSGNYLGLGSGGEHAAFIWNVETDEAWGFLQLRDDLTAQSQALGTTWTAEAAEYYPSLTNASGLTGNRNWGSRACSLLEIGGLITQQDLRDVYAGGAINHALAFAAPLNGGTNYVAPATRSDGNDDSGNPVVTIPTGYPGAGAANPAFHMDWTAQAMRFRFPAGVDLSGVGNTLFGNAMARAIRDYGMYLVDTSAAIAFYVEDPRTLGSIYHMQGPDANEPYHDLSWPGGDMITPRPPVPAPSGYHVIHLFPWDQLQALDPISS